MWYNNYMQYNFQEFNIYNQVKNELDDFFGKKIKIAGTKDNKKLGYDYNQAETVNLVEYVGASKFEKGEKDTEGQDKIYLNSSVFRADVASKQIDIDLKNILFIPDDSADEATCILSRKLFKKWAKDKRFSEDLNEFVERFPFYGSIVAKKRGKDYDIVPINTLRNQQDAKTLNTASYVIIEHNMPAWEAQLMPNWDLSGIEYKWDDVLTIYERYGRVPKRFFDKTADKTASVDTMSIVIVDHKGKKENSGILFLEEIKNRPFEEAHWKKRDGRWLGVGEIENNFENQKARNFIFNLRTRSALWSSKQIFQSSDESVAKNLVKEVRDGDTLYIQPNGQITQVNTQTKALADYNAMDDVVEKNSDQKSFTYEVATGEALPSGTPFRLGAVLSNSVNNHFSLKREKLELFIRNILNEFILPSFEKDLSKEDIIYLADGEEAFDELLTNIITAKTNRFIVDFMKKNGRMPRPDEVDKYKKRLLDLKGYQISLDKTLKDIKYKIDIIITGENVDIDKKLTTYSTLYQLFSQMGDPRASVVLNKIMRLQGEQAPKEKPMAQMLPQLQQITQPQFNQPQTTNEAIA